MKNNNRAGPLNWRRAAPGGRAPSSAALCAALQRGNAALQAPEPEPARDGRATLPGTQ